jgi:hypothetical protein
MKKNNLLWALLIAFLLAINCVAASIFFNRTYSSKKHIGQMETSRVNNVSANNTVNDSAIEDDGTEAACYPANDTTCMDEDGLYFAYHHTGPLQDNLDTCVYNFCNLKDTTFGMFERGNSLVYKHFAPNCNCFEFEVPKGFNFNHITSNMGTEKSETFWNKDKSIIIEVCSRQNWHLGGAYYIENPDKATRASAYRGRRDEVKENYRVKIEQAVNRRNEYVLSGKCSAWNDAHTRKYTGFYERGLFHGNGVDGSETYVTVTFQSQMERRVDEIINNEVKRFGKSKYQNNGMED